MSAQSISAAGGHGNAPIAAGLVGVGQEVRLLYGGNNWNSQIVITSVDAGMLSRTRRAVTG